MEIFQDVYLKFKQVGVGHTKCLKCIRINDICFLKIYNSNEFLLDANFYKRCVALHIDNLWTAIDIDRYFINYGDAHLLKSKHIAKKQIVYG